MADLPGSALQHTVSRQDPAPGWDSKWLSTLHLIASLALLGPTSCSACLAHGRATLDLGISWGSVHPLLPQGYLYLLFTDCTI